MAQSRLAEVEQAVQHLNGSLEAALLRARLELGRKDFEGARRTANECITRAPRALMPRVVLSVGRCGMGNA